MFDQHHSIRSLRSPTLHHLLFAVILCVGVCGAPERTEARPSNLLSLETLAQLGIADTEVVLEASLPLAPGLLFAAAEARSIGTAIDLEIDRKLDDYLSLGGLQSLAGLSGIVLALSLEGGWDRPFGIEWLTLQEVTLIRAYAFDGSRKTGFVGSYKLGDTTLTAAGIVVEDGGEHSVELTSVADEFSIADIRRLAGRLGVEPPFDPVLDDNRLLFRNVITVLEVGQQVTFSMKASTRIMDTVEADALFTMVTSESGQPQLLVSFHVSHFSFGAAAPALEGSLVGSLAFPDAVITIAREETELESGDMNAAEAEFFDEVFGTGDYKLSFVEGVNFGASLPLSALPETILTPLGMSPQDVVIVEGAPGLSFGFGSSGFRAADMLLRAKLPPMAPPSAPEWFVEGELSLEITGRPSIAFVGAVTIYVAGPDESEGDELTFFTRGAIGRDGANFSLSLAGGMTTDKPWETPFGIEWMTLNEVVAKISINAVGSLGLGFSADLVIGEKDIDVAVFVAVNLYTGVPTNFIFEGESAAGVGLSDLVQLQQRMARVRRRDAPRIPLDRLPDVAVKNLHLKFAPKDDADLGVEAGLAIGGDLVVADEEFAGVHFSLDRDGILAHTYLGAFTFGPIVWEDASLDLALTVPEQRFALQGGAIVGGTRRHLEVDLTPGGLLANVPFLDSAREAAAAVEKAAREAAEAAAQKADRAAEQTALAARKARDEARRRAALRLRALKKLKRKWRR